MRFRAPYFHKPVSKDLFRVVTITQMLGTGQAWANSVWRLSKDSQVLKKFLMCYHLLLVWCGGLPFYCRQPSFHQFTSPPSGYGPIVGNFDAQISWVWVRSQQSSKLEWLAAYILHYTPKYTSYFAGDIPPLYVTMCWSYPGFGRLISCSWMCIHVLSRVCVGYRYDMML